MLTDDVTMCYEQTWPTNTWASVSLMFLSHFDVFCDLLLNRRTATWNLLVLYNKKTEKNVNDVIHTSVLQWIIGKNLSKCENNLTHYILLHLIGFHCL